METYRYHGHSMSDPDTTYRSSVFSLACPRPLLPTLALPLFRPSLPSSPPPECTPHSPSLFSRDDIKKMRTDFDPIIGLKSRMLEAGFATEDEIKVGRDTQLQRDFKAIASSCCLGLLWDATLAVVMTWLCRRWTRRSATRLSRRLRKPWQLSLLP